MINEVFEQILARRIDLIKLVLSKKGKEYSSSTDRLANFKRASAVLQTTPEKALIGMMVKHFVSILDIVDNIEKELPSTEMLEEKIGDDINYHILLESLIKERILHRI